MAQNALLSLKGLYKSFGATQVLKGIDLDVAEGEFVTVLGPSGCGKTTTLRVIAGLTQCDRGEVWLEGKNITELPPEQRNVNTVFQSYALFPHMNVEKNIAYGLKVRGVAKEERRARVMEMLRLVQLTGYEKRMPSELSGGQRQRIAIARSVVLSPRLLLLDEPLGALDMKLRQQMQFELKQLQKSLGIAFVYITHDQEEALNMSDRVAIMNGGVIEQIGTPNEVYDRPVTRFAASFIGQSTLLDATVKSADENGSVLAYGDSRFPGRAIDFEAKPGDGVSLCLRCEKVRVTNRGAGRACLPGVLLSQQEAGSTVRREVRLAGGETVRVISPSLRGGEKLRVGESVSIAWDPEDIAIVPRAEANDGKA